MNMTIKLINKRMILLKYLKLLVSLNFFILKKYYIEYISFIHVIIIVSQILGVSGSSGPEPDNKILQNKQCTGGGVPASSPMLKLERAMESLKKMSVLQTYIFTHLSLGIASLFIKKDDHPPFLENG